MTTRTHTATRPGPVTFDVDLTAGRIDIVVEDREHAHITVSTADKDGPSAGSVNDTMFSERDERLVVRVPNPTGGGGVTQHVTSQGGGVTVVQAGGSVYGTVIGAVVGDVVHFGGGGVIVSGGRGAVVVGGSPIVVEARLPRGSRLVAGTTSADVDTTGPLDGVAVKTMSGDVAIRAYAGPGRIKTMSGDITVHAVAESSLRATSMSGSIRTTGARLALDARSMSGRVSSS